MLRKELLYFVSLFLFFTLPIQLNASTSHPTPVGYDDLFDSELLSSNCNVVFVRHAERPRGENCLTTKGRRQARVLKTYLEGITSIDGALGRDFDLIFMSKEMRVHHTLRFYLDFLNGKNSDIIINPNGDEDGVDFSECCYRGKYYQWYKVKNSRKKILQACAESKADGGPTNLLVGGHGQLFKYLLKKLLGKSLHEYPHHAEAYILKLNSLEDKPHFSKIELIRPIQSERTTANPKDRPCDVNYE